MSHQEPAPVGRAVLLAAPANSSHDTLLWSPVAGRPLLAWSLATLRSVPEIGPIVLVVPRSRLTDAAALIRTEVHSDTHALALPSGAPFVAALDLAQDLTPGAARLPLSLRERGPRSEVEAPRVTVLHDATRPLLTAEQVHAIIAASLETGIAVGVEPIKETIKRVAEGRVVETVPRDELALLIPPLALRTDVMPALLATPGRPSPTPIMEVVAAALRLGIVIRGVALAGSSLAVTSPEDIAVAEKLLGHPTPGLTG